MKRPTKGTKYTSEEGFYLFPDGRRDDASFFAELLNEPDLLRYRPEELERPDAPEGPKQEPE